MRPVSGFNIVDLEPLASDCERSALIKFIFILKCWMMNCKIIKKRFFFEYTDNK